MSKKKFIPLIIFSTLVIGCTKIPENFNGSIVHFTSSDGELNRFMDEYSHRNLRYDEYAAGQFAVSDGTNFAKNWETMGLAWHNASLEAMGENKFNKLYTFLSTISQDSLGMIYNTHQSFDAYTDEAGKNTPQGWPFPDWRVSTDSSLDTGNLDAVHTTAFEFTDALDLQSIGWKTNYDDIDIHDYLGYLSFNTNGYMPKEQPYRIYKDDIDELLKYCGGIDTRYAPIFEWDLEFNGNNVSDIYVIWKTKKGGDTWYSAPQSLFATTPIDSFSHFHERQYIEMYLDENWDNQIVTAIGLEVRPVEGKALSLSNGILNYIRPQYDTRQSNGTYQWILALYNYYRFTHDVKALRELMPKARRAIMFLIHALEGEKGLLNIGYLYGHNGIGVYKEDGSWARDAWEGIGNGYWDITASSEINLESNTYFYQALNAMAFLERAIELEGIQYEQAETIKNRLPGHSDVVYNMTEESLSNLASLVKTNMEREIKPVLKENGRYQNEGGFWNPVTGRYALGINEKTGKIIDYGFVYFNEEAIAAGIGTDSQAKSIMDWIDGRRIVSGDKSTGKDIYFYEFAPRSTTMDCEEAYSFTALGIINTMLRNKSSWSKQVQNGGAVITWSYYDLMSRKRVYGAQNAYERLKEIRDWYIKVLDNTVDDGYDFYAGYYDTLNDEATYDNPENDGIYSIQDSNRKGPGALGLDAEFIESVILIKSFPDVLFGMDTIDNEVISFTHSLPKDLKFYQIENMKFGDVVYSIRMKKNSFEIFNLKGKVGLKQQVNINIPIKKSNPTITINGEKFNDYQIVNGYISFSYEFTNLNIEIK